MEPPNRSEVSSISLGVEPEILNDSPQPHLLELVSNVRDRLSLTLCGRLPWARSDGRSDVSVSPVGEVGREKNGTASRRGF